MISIEDYLAGELVSPVKHEYLGGSVYAMAGARTAHNIIAGNIFGQLHARLRGRPCQPFNSDMKIRVCLPTHARFYYADTSVVCRPEPLPDSFQDEPVVLVEVVSRATRRTDEGEKKEAYQTIASLGVYLIVEQESAKVVAYRRTEGGFIPEVYDGLATVLPLPKIGTELSLAEIYERVRFSPEGVDLAARSEEGTDE
jgi:Uma2 family endonuclease